MRVYTAGWFSTYGTGTPYSIATTLAKPPYVLESYHYMNDKKMALVREKKYSIFLDSGAYSMFTQGAAIDLQAYARFIARNRDMIHLASNLDVIGQDAEQGSYERQKQLEKMLGPGIVWPVHHARDRDEWLARYLSEGYEYIFLGGMVPESTPYLYTWLDHVFHNFLTNPDGTAKVKVHGFGLTTQELMFRYPWYSVDSTRWVLASRYGMILLDLRQPNGTIKDYIIDFSTRSPRRKDIKSWHYSQLIPEQQHRIAERLEEIEATRVIDPYEKELEKVLGFKQGYNPKCLSESYGWRDHFNINYLVRAQARNNKTFKRQQGTLFV